MKYLIVLKATYLTFYYFRLINRPSENYVISVVISCVTACIVTLITLFFKNSEFKANFPFESLLFHGLSYEEWRNAKEVKRRMDRVQKITDSENFFPEELYLVLLLILSFSGMIEYRPETPEEKSNEIVGNLPQEGDVLTSLRFDSADEDSPPIKRERRVDREESQMFESMRQGHIEYLKDKYYKGVTLSRLIFEGVRLVFRRKKIGPKKPTRTQAFMKAFGLNSQ